MLNETINVEIKNNKLIIIIDIDYVKFITETCKIPVTVSDKLLFASEVKTELLKEEEDGTNLIHIMLDSAIYNALENGSDGLHG